MTPDDDFDAFLVHQLAETPLAGDSFVRAVEARLDRRRGVRRGIVAVAGAVASISVIVGMIRTPAPLISVSAITPQTTAAMLVLTALCCVVWIAAESRRPLTMPALDTRRGP